MDGSEEQVLFTKERALAIDAWARVENALCHVAVSTCYPEAPRHVAIGFHSIENFRSKLVYTDALVREVHHTSAALLDNWSKLCTRVSAASTSRNKLVHRVAIYFMSGKVGRRFGLLDWRDMHTAVPNTYNHAPRHTAPSDAICLLDLVDIRLKFYRLFGDLADFEVRMIARSEDPPASKEPQVLPTLRELRNKHREALSLPPLPARRKPKSEPRQT